MTTAQLPPAMAEIVEMFATSPPADRLELLLDYSDELPPLPDRLRDHPGRMERVPECQSPLFVAAEVAPDGRVQLFFDAPPESPTTRGFAGIFHAGLNGLPAEDVLSLPPQVTADLALAEVVSPLRLRGAVALLARLQEQVRRQVRI